MKDDDRSSDSGFDLRGVPSLRLIFEYRGDEVHLVSKSRISMVAPRSDALEFPKEATGFWFEVRSLKDQLLYRQVTENPIKRFFEVRSKDPDYPMEWQEAKDPSGTFVVLIPDLDDAEELVFVGSRDEPGRAKSAERLHRFSLRGKQLGKEVG